MAQQMNIAFYASTGKSELHFLEIYPDEKRPFFVEPSDPELQLFDNAVRKILALINEHSKIKFKASKSVALSSNTIVVVFAKIEQLKDARFYYNFVNSPFRYIEPLLGSYPTAKGVHQNTALPPVITLGAVDFFSMFEEAPGMDFETQNEITYWRDKRAKNRDVYRYNLDQRIKFLDSSIWHRYIPLSKDFETRFTQMLEEMIQHHNAGLYKSLAGLATLEFQCRMLLNSFIAPVSNRGHHIAVTPFKFHSETVMHEKTLDMIERFWNKPRERGTRLLNVQWNLLVVDDFANVEISKLQNKPAQKTAAKSKVSKSWLIERLLKFQDKPELGIKFNVEIKGTNGGNKDVIEEAIQALMKPEGPYFQVIMLDYLLGESISDPSFKSYGHEFLLELATHPKKGGFKRGPAGCFWIFSISSFPVAFYDKLRQMNWESSTEQWQIKAGGDPITTPEFFRYNLLQLFARQISEYYKHDAALERWIENFSHFSDLQDWWRAMKTHLNTEEYKRKILTQEGNNGSAFARSLDKFMLKQREDEQFKKKLKDILSEVSKYKKGQPYDWVRVSLFDIYKNRENKYKSVCHQIESQLSKFFFNSEEILQQKAKIISANQETTLVHAGQFLYQIPESLFEGVHSKLSLSRPGR